MQGVFKAYAFLLLRLPNQHYCLDFLLMALTRGKHPLRMYPGTEGMMKWSNPRSAKHTVPVQSSSLIQAVVKMGLLVNTCIAVAAVCTASYALTENLNYKQELDALKQKVDTLEKGRKRP